MQLFDGVLQVLLLAEVREAKAKSAMNVLKNFIYIY
jgi:hypothetical protein